MNDLQKTRTLDMVAAEIRTFTASMLNNVIEIGRRMAEAKEMLPYGSFGKWVKQETGYSASTANNFMRLYEEYGAAQGSLFGAQVECQTFGKLSYTKALALLAVPSDERESFVQDNDVEDMSTRELKAKIKELDEAKKALHEAEEAAEGSALRIGELEDKAVEAARAAKEARAEADAAKAKLDELLANPPEPEVIKELDTVELARYIEGAKEEERAKINDELCAADEKLAAARKKAKEAAQAAEEAEKRAEEAENRAKEAEEKAARTAEDAAQAAELHTQLEAVKKELAQADPATAEFKGLFSSVATSVAKLVDLAAKVPEGNQPNVKAALMALAAQLEGAAK